MCCNGYQTFEISDESLIKGYFKQCWISNALNGSEDGRLNFSPSHVLNSAEVLEQEIHDRFDTDEDHVEFEGFSFEFLFTIYTDKQFVSYIIIDV